MSGTDALAWFILAPMGAALWIAVILAAIAAWRMVRDGKL